MSSSLDNLRIKHELFDEPLCPLLLGSVGSVSIAGLVVSLFDEAPECS